MERAPGPEFLKKRELRKFDLSWRKGELVYGEEQDTHKWWKCEARFALGHYEDYGGWEHRHPWTQRCHKENPFPVPQWRGQPVKKLYVLAEQGLGDEVMLSQTVLDAKKICGEVVLECQDRLQSIFERSLGVRTVASVVLPNGNREAQDFEADAWVNLGDLPRLYRRKWSDFPREAYLKADPERAASLSSYKGRTGISWRGAQGTYTAEAFSGLAPGAVSLQYDQGPDEDVEQPPVDLKNDLEGVFALVSVLDRLITVSTSVAHFAASQGVNVDLIVAPMNTGVRSHILPWRWLDFTQNVPRKAWWYPDSVRVYRSIEEYRAYEGRG
jgi:hypothetical protein